MLLVSTSSVAASASDNLRLFGDWNVRLVTPIATTIKADAEQIDQRHQQALSSSHGSGDERRPARRRRPERRRAVVPAYRPRRRSNQDGPNRNENGCRPPVKNNSPASSTILSASNAAA